MASKPLRPCRHPGCPELTRDGWCPKHKPRQAPHRESASWHHWYSLPVWTEDLRPGQLLREPFCRECARRDLRTRATDVDHIRDHKGDWALFTDRSNLQSLCHSCHSRKTMGTQWQRVRKKRADFHSGFCRYRASFGRGPHRRGAGAHPGGVPCGPLPRGKKIPAGRWKTVWPPPSEKFSPRRPRKGDDENAGTKTAHGAGGGQWPQAPDQGRGGREAGRGGPCAGAGAGGAAQVAA